MVVQEKSVTYYIWNSPLFLCDGLERGMRRFALKRYILTGKPFPLFACICIIFATLFMILHASLPISLWKRRVNLDRLKIAPPTVSTDDSDDFIQSFDSVTEMVKRSNNGNAQTKSNYDQVLVKYPWINRTNVIPNYFTIGDRNRYLGSHTPIVFVHHHKSAGQTMKICLTKFAKKLGYPYPSLISFKYITDKYAELPELALPAWTTFVGGYTFGVCSRLRTPCSYFTVLREPYERMVSHYEFCQDHVKDHICRPSGSRNMTVNQWALKVGSHLFKQLFNDPDLCLTKRQGKDNLACWKLYQTYFETELNKAEKENVLNYVLDNLENWFTLIGIVDDIDSTIDMLQETYKLPFVNKCKKREHTLVKNDMRPNEDEERTEFEMSKKAMKDALLADSRVKDALRYDVIIYKKAVEIFERQKKSFLADKQL